MYLKPPCGRRRAVLIFLVGVAPDGVYIDPSLSPNWR